MYIYLSVEFYNFGGFSSQFFPPSLPVFAPQVSDEQATRRENQQLQELHEAWEIHELHGLHYIFIC